MKPEMRFNGYTEEWEQRKLGELVKEGILEAPLDGNHGEKHPTSDEYVDSGIPFLMASDIHNGEVNIHSCKYITKERAERLDKGFARNGDVLLTHKATIGETAILSNLMTEYAMLTPQVTYYRIKNEERLNREYLYSFFNSLDFQTELKTKAAQSTRPYIGITAQQNLKIILPAEIDEQRKIGLYFRNLDHLITLHQRKLERLINVKKSMLKKMFPQDGEKKPEIRFEEFTGDWEQRKLDDVAQFSKGHGYSKGDLVESGTPIILYGRLYTRYETLISDVDTFVVAKNDSIYSKGGEVIVPASGETAEDIARAATVEKAGVLLGGDLNVITPNSNVNSEFISISISNGTPQRELAKRAQGKSVVHIHNEDIKNLLILFPSIEEQEKIAKYFWNLDQLITLQKRKVEKLQDTKKAFLNKMFV